MTLEFLYRSLMFHYTVGTLLDECISSRYHLEALMHCTCMMSYRTGQICIDFLTVLCLFRFGALTYMTIGEPAVLSNVYFSDLLWRSWNILDPLLLVRFSSSIIKSLGTLTFFPKFRPSHTHQEKALQ